MKYATAISPDRMKAAGAGEQPDADERSADQFDHALHPEQRRQVQMREHGDRRKAEQLGRAMVEKGEAGDKAQDAQHARLPDEPPVRLSGKTQSPSQEFLGRSATEPAIRLTLVAGDCTTIALILIAAVLAPLAAPT